MEEKKKKKSVLSIIIKRLLKPHNFIPLIFLMTSGTFAWFMYNSKVDSTIDITVKSWNITFSTEDSSISDHVVFTVANLYPGMETEHFVAYITNNGVTTADVSFKITAARILDDSHYDQSDTGGETTEDIIDLLADDYPFTIDVGITSSVLAAGAQSTFYVDCSWPYEQPAGSEFDDSDDTSWGIAAYEYLNEHPSSSCIQIEVDIDVVQREQQETASVYSN